MYQYMICPDTGQFLDQHLFLRVPLGMHNFQLLAQIGRLAMAKSASPTSSYTGSAPRKTLADASCWLVASVSRCHSDPAPAETIHAKTAPGSLPEYRYARITKISVKIGQIACISSWPAPYQASSMTKEGRSQRVWPDLF